MTTTIKIKTRIGQAKHMGRWEAAAQMVRLVREMQDRMEEAGLIAKEDITNIDGIVHTFLDEIPKKVSDEIREG